MGVTRIAGASGGADGDFARDWGAVRADADIQYAPVDIPPPEPPDTGWLQDVLEWLSVLLEPVARLIGTNWTVIGWTLLALLVGLLLFAVWRLVAPRLAAISDGEAGDTALVPDRQQALQLLEDADRLAAEGRFDEATHLLLQRSVGQIAEVRPELVDPSTTARELAMLPALPQAAARAFGVIAERVERSLFALRALSAEDWQAARAAYAEFALGYTALRQGTAR